MNNFWNETTTKSQCPFSTSKGYSTLESRKEYMKTRGLKEAPTSLQAHLDVISPLYFWQIYSIWGKQPILDICADFYYFIYLDDDAPWFREVFERVASKQHHIMTQAGYWIDAMGGGKVYHGGLGRLAYHHYYNADTIMNAKGANRWMQHMKKAIQKNHSHFQKDPRILPCLVDFLETKMKIYAKLQEWEFDASDFRLEGFYPDNEVMPTKEEESETASPLEAIDEEEKKGDQE
jgi:hypothetical protein